MKPKLLLLLLVLNAAFAAAAADSPPPVFQQTAAPPAQRAPQAAAPAADSPAATPTPPPAGPAKRSAAELEKLVAPIALYPDPLLATILPASVYPLEIVQAARFVSDTNNLAKLDAQPWDDSVKAVARVPDAIKKLNDDLPWTIELGEAFLAQDKEILDAIQAMRSRAQKAGTLQTTPQQIIVVTNMVVEKTVEQQVVVVTNTVVQIQPSSSSVVYVPAYNPATVYYPPPAYVYNPMAPLVTFTAGVAMGAIIANNCNWHGGGCYHGDVDIDINKNVNRNVNREGGAGGARASSTGAQKKWQPDQSRLSKSGAPSAATSARNSEARGWGGASGARPSTGAAGTRPSSGTAGARPSTGTPSGNRPAPSTGASRPTSSGAGSRPSPSPSASSSRSGSGSAFGGTSSGASARSSSSRGSSSRSGGGGGGGGGRSRGGGGGRR